MSQLTKFYHGLGTDDRGRTLAEIQSWDRDRLESYHDYIQWMFPLPEPSGANPMAPILTAEDRKTFQTDQIIQENLIRSLGLMLQFYGLKYDAADGRVTVERDKSHGNTVAYWMRPGNHNLLRITRILRCLRLAGLEQQARGLFDYLQATYKSQPGVFGANSFEYWRRVMADAI